MPGGKENLRVPTSAEAREIGRKGGVASGAARRRKASITAAIDACLQGKVTDEELVQELKQQGLTGLTNADAIALKMIAKAKTGVWTLKERGGSAVRSRHTRRETQRAPHPGHPGRGRAFRSGPQRPEQRRTGGPGCS